METLTAVQRYRFDDSLHAHFLEDKPLCGTTTAISILDKPGLTWWASGMAVGELGWLNAKKASKEDRLVSAGAKLTDIKLMTIDGYLALLDKAYKAFNVKKEKSADEGTDLHGLVEQYIKGELNGKGVLFEHEKIKDFVDWSKKNVKRFLFSELHCYSKSLHVGGIADFAYQDMDGNNVLADLKSSEKPYFSHYIQLGAYDIQISENGGFNAKGERIWPIPAFPFKYHAIFCARGGLNKPFFNKDTVKVKEAFCWAVKLYQSKLFFENELEAQNA